MEQPTITPALFKDHPWAIEEEYLKSLEAFFAHEKIEAFFEPEGDNRGYIASIQDGVAVINVHGPIGLRMGFIGWLRGGVDAGQLKDDIERAAVSSDVQAILLHIDSPGGMVAGTQEVATAIKNCEKPIFAFTDSQMASGAYWIASAADKIVATPTAMIGSIGVVATHYDYSKADERYGVKTTYITAGKFKRIANDAEPLSEEGREYIQELVDGSYQIFVGDVARYRGTDPQKIINTQARMYLAANAKDAGLIDEVADISHTFKILRREAKLMDLTEFKTDHSDLYQQVIEEGKKSVVFVKEDIKPEWADALKSEGAEAERMRISDIRESAFEGQDELVNQLIKDGATVDEARKRLIADEKAKKTEALGGLKKTEEKTGALGGNEDDLKAAGMREGETVDAAIDRLTREHQAANEGMSYSAALDAVLKANPKLAQKYEGGV